jgi:hypothetical protein
VTTEGDLLKRQNLNDFTAISLTEQLKEATPVVALGSRTSGVVQERDALPQETKTEVPVNA